MTGGRPPLYARMLRLRHVRLRPAVAFLLFEGSIGLGVLLALADFVNGWGIIAIPVTVAAMVKLNDMVAGSLAQVAPAGLPLPVVSAETPLPPQSRATQPGRGASMRRTRGIVGRARLGSARGIVYVHPQPGDLRRPDTPSTTGAHARTADPDTAPGRRPPGGSPTPGGPGSAASPRPAPPAASRPAPPAASRSAAPDAARPASSGASRPVPPAAARSAADASRPASDASRPAADASRPASDASRPAADASRPVPPGSRSARPAAGIGQPDSADASHVAASGGQRRPSNARRRNQSSRLGDLSEFRVRGRGPKRGDRTEVPDPAAEPSGQSEPRRPTGPATDTALVHSAGEAPEHGGLFPAPGDAADPSRSPTNRPAGTAPEAVGPTGAVRPTKESPDHTVGFRPPVQPGDRTEGLRPSSGADGDHVPSALEAALPAGRLRSPGESDRTDGARSPRGGERAEGSRSVGEADRSAIGWRSSEPAERPDLTGTGRPVEPAERAGRLRYPSSRVGGAELVWSEVPTERTPLEQPAGAVDQVSCQGLEQSSVDRPPADRPSAAADTAGAGRVSPDRASGDPQPADPAEPDRVDRNKGRFA